MTTSGRIVADGQERLLTNSEVRAELEEVVSEIEASYAPRLEAAGFLGKLLLRWRMKKEIEREVELRAPSGALYVCA